MTTRISAWMQTWAGNAIEPANPDGYRFDIIEIAQHLCKVNRFQGATKVPYSVTGLVVVRVQEAQPTEQRALQEVQDEEAVVTDQKKLGLVWCGRAVVFKHVIKRRTFSGEAFTGEVDLHLWKSFSRNNWSAEHDGYSTYAIAKTPQGALNKLERELTKQWQKLGLLLGKTKMRRK